ncbi:hypothetical protein O0L34_g12204 [Tuta absoluta]|nr:hypothetical protein O0L34_g12204 [Tuta absoluta]
MSDNSSVALNKSNIIIKSQGTPILLKKENKIKLFQGDRVIKNIKFGPASSLYQEDVIYESKPKKWDSPVKITITNRIDLLKNITRTIITYVDQMNGTVLSEKSSDSIARFIGQSNYEAVIAGLLNITDEEIKVKAIMALLTMVAVEDQTTQTVQSEDDFYSEVKIKMEPPKAVEEKCCQTTENSMDFIFKFKQRKRIKRRQLTPYPIKDTPKKVIKKIIVNPTVHFQQQKLKQETSKMQHIPTMEDSKTTVTNLMQEELDQLSDFTCLDENSSDSTLTLSGSLVSDRALHNAEKEFILNAVGKCTSTEPTTMPVVDSQKHYITLPNREVLTVPVKPEFPYHVATPEILRSLSDEDKKKLVYFQAFLDFKHCLMPSDDGCLPIHYAVLNNDVDLLKRQCVVLKYRHQSLDVTYENMTPLQLSICQDTPQCTALLLQHGADPLMTDEEQRTCLHLAAESSSDHLRAVISHCEANAREILQDNELWKEEYEGKSKDILAAILLKHMCEMSDDQGYTPLMVAAKSGNYNAVKMLLEASPDCRDLQMPNSGNTALFLAVEGACHDASNRGNKSKVADHYSCTISILLESHADVTKPNHSGITINDLLTDNSNAELSMIFANKVTSRFFDGHLPGGSQFDNYMLLKNDKGNVDIAELKKTDQETAKTQIKIEVNKSDTDNCIKTDDVTVAKLKKAENATKIQKGPIIINIPKNKTSVEKVQQNLATIKRVRKQKIDKPIILENITIAQSKPIMNINTVNTQNVKFINPNDKLVSPPKKPTITYTNKKFTPTILANKRKTTDEPGPSGKKVKSLNT